MILPKTTMRDLARRPPSTSMTSRRSPTSARGGARRTARRSWRCSPPTRRDRSDRALSRWRLSLKGAYNGKFAAGAARVPMIAVHGVSMRYGSKVLFDDVTTTFSAGRRYGLTGPNGAGKSTFMKLLTGELQAAEGRGHAPAEARRAAPGPVRLRRVPRRRHGDHGQRAPVGGARGARPALRQARHDRRGRHAPRRARRHRRRGGRLQRRKRRGRAARRASTSPTSCTSGRWRSCRAARRCACCSRRRCSASRRRCCSTSRPTTSTSTRSTG